MKKTILIILLGSIISFLQAQNNGFGGKYCLLKSNAINGTYGFFNNIQTEFLFHRDYTLSIGYDFFSTNVKQSYISAEMIKRVNAGIVMANKANVSYTGINIELRRYFNEIPAPNGFYVLASYKNGNLDIEKGSYTSDLFDNFEPNNTITYSLSGIGVNSFGAGAGYQKAINKWLFIGGNISFDYTFYGDVIEGVPSKSFSGVAKNFGPNILPINLLYNQKEPFKKSYGFSGVFQIGLLLF
jgi:hypothetical protein